MNRYRPSQANYWGNCAAFQRFTLDLPEDFTNDAAREGTCAAWVSEVVLTGDATSCDELLGEQHENGWIVTDEMVDDVQEYVDLIRSIGGEITAEEHVQASAEPLIEGTLDNSVTTFHDDGKLRIIDLKYGRIVVETTAKQLIPYGWGKFLKLALNGQTVKEIHLSIYQPRAIHKDGIYRTRVVTPEQLHSEFIDLWHMAVESEKPDSIATPGAHCLNCSAAPGCHALAQSAYKAAFIVESRDHRNMSANELAQELDFLDKCKGILAARFKAIETEAEARMKNESIPGWTVEPKYGNRSFSVSGQNVQLLTGINPWQNKLVTPKELERRGATPEQLNSITRKMKTGHKLTRLTSDDIASKFAKGTK